MQNNENIEAAIIQNSQFKQMVKARNRFALYLSFSVLLIYFIFIGVASFSPQILAQTLGDRVITIGMPIAALVIILSWLITGIYIYITNQHFDRIKAQLKREYQYE
ncbi:DUF485 domain-containing protein [Acinetobacter sichuanensis]|uniref:DUF485 domain-containing protein n=1 Tax=Acinetobacter sichuanensis TaxID=2136183 RepID=UPI00280EC9F2|nr:DUF485 domain-containing protein [Acinetobacter sichuanensis]MDQ9021214.1 DUF485 domain-containing protein [Acinetobacter sichuanensis]